VLCAGKCDGAGQCAFPDVGTNCGLCSACDGTGRCTATPADDSACDAIDCSGLDQSCKAYDDLKADRCQGTGACKAPNAGATCTSWHDTCQADAGSGGDGGGAHADGGTGGDGGGDTVWMEVSAPLVVLRRIVYWVASVEAVQLRLIWLPLTALAARFDGAVGAWVSGAGAPTTGVFMSL